MLLCLHQQLRRRNNVRFLQCMLERRLTTIKQTEDVQLKYTEFKKSLRNHKIQYKEGPTCLQFECRLCNSDLKQGAKPKTAYVNKRTGVFLCPSCDVKKTLSDALSVYDDSRQPSGVPSATQLQYKLSSANVVPVQQDICDGIGIRDLKAGELQLLGAQYDAATNCIHFPLRNAAHKIVGEKILRISDKTEQTLPHGNCSGLLVYQGRSATKTKAILVSNLLDFLALLTAQRLDSHCVICLPYGLKSLPQECLPAMEAFNELVFWFDYDYTGWDTARLFANKMDEKRCLLIRPTDTEPAPHYAHEQGLNLRQIVQRALPVQHKSITTFSSLRSDILSELQNIEKVNGVKWKRFPILNKLLKGHRKGELTIITGPTGSGKTTFMSEYSLDLALQGVPTLWGSFEIRNSRLASTLLRQFVGYSLEEKLHEFDHWANAFEKYPLYFMTFHGQQPLKIVMEAIEHAQYVHDINHVIIDNLQFMMGISSSYRVDKFWEQDAIIASFRAFATKCNVHVTLVMHPRKERDADELTTSSVFGTAKATQEADNVLIIQDKRLTSLRGKKYLQVVKNRYSGDLGIMPLEFDKESLSYAKPKEKKEKLDGT